MTTNYVIKSLSHSKITSIMMKHSMFVNSKRNESIHVMKIAKVFEPHIFQNLMLYGLSLFWCIVFLGFVFLSFMKNYIARKLYIPSNWKIDRSEIHFECDDENHCDEILQNVSSPKNNNFGAVEALFQICNYFHPRTIPSSPTYYDCKCKENTRYKQSFRENMKDALKAAYNSFSLRKYKKTTVRKRSIRYGTYQNNKIMVLEIGFVRKNVLSSPSVTSALHKLKQISHENILKFHGVYTEPYKLCVVFHQARIGSLHDLLIYDYEKLDFIFICSLINDLISAMKYIHDSPIKYHRRLTSKCCLIDSPWILKLTGFAFEEVDNNLRIFNGKSEGKGNSIICPRSKTFNSCQNEIKTCIHEKLIDKTICPCYDLLWTAPEILKSFTEPPHSIEIIQKADVYSFGVILRELITMEGPNGCKSSSLLACEKISEIIHEENGENYFTHSTSFTSFVEGMDDFYGISNCCLVTRNESRPSFTKINKMANQVFIKNGVRQNIFDNLMNLLTIYQRNIDELVSEKLGDLLKEKTKAEYILNCMFPRQVIFQLIRGIPVEPEYFDNVTIYFSDIVGFTKICSQIDSAQVASLLDELYIVFDEIVQHYNVYKVETIGDAYMAVSGVPVRKGQRHATEICAMAFHIIREVSKHTFILKESNNQSVSLNLQIRIGVHSGPVAAGIVGTKMPRYCLFGETSTIAEKLESTGRPMCVHVSESTINLLEDETLYNVEQHMTVNLKNKKQSLKTFILTEKNNYYSENRVDQRKARGSNASDTKLYSHETIDNLTSEGKTRNFTKNKLRWLYRLSTYL